MGHNSYLTGWYIFSAMGLYPVELSRGFYFIGSSMCCKMKVYLQGPDGDNGEFIIEAHQALEKNIYIQSNTLNGKVLNKPYFHHSDLTPRSCLVFEMVSKPNKKWGVNPNEAPP